MNTRILLVAAALFTMVACKKDGAGKISFKIKSVSSTTVPVNGFFRVVLSYTANGHSIDTVGIIKLRINQLQTATLTNTDTLYYFVPDYPNNQSGEIQVDMDYNSELIAAETPPMTGNPPHPESDSLNLKIFLNDASGNHSDTLKTGLIVVERQ